MQVEVIASVENPLLQRREVTLKVSGFSATPSNSEVAVALCESLGVSAENLVVNGIEQRMGRKSVTVKAKIYASPAANKAVEREKKAKKTAAKK
ncbi:TPA: hypothetical protein HA318_02400 [Candidatus Micrarchaeota archaeon]|nr:MAG: hypothetical protein AUJ65_00465 [Candidatus Micrarchaeota archaeon CG1_02_51_15]HII38829.1 hypothetical protein [Candidatus Micrarchaeota archaeon]